MHAVQNLHISSVEGNSKLFLVSLLPKAAYWPPPPMPTTKPKTFRAKLELLGKSLPWTVARIPFDPKTTWPQRRGHRVRGTVNGIPFRSTLISAFKGGSLVLIVNKQMQRAAKARLGDQVTIQLEPDLEERPAELPPEFTRILKSEPTLRKWFQQTLSQSDQREIGKFLSQPKSPAARQNRAEQMAERLMLTMEGEIETPPILRIAFQRQPSAAQGWQSMTPTQRRRHLLGIFYYRTPDARQRRAEQAIADAITLIQRAKTTKSRPPLS
jgi:uncharacterized protein YdeI (YjbR/CyaY-like superfamily)